MSVFPNRTASGRIPTCVPQTATTTTKSGTKKELKEELAKDEDKILTDNTEA